jgi:hypothetical protein
MNFDLDPGSLIRHDPIGAFFQRHTCRGKDNVARRPLKETRSERLLKASDAAAHVRFGQPKAACRA